MSQAVKLYEHDFLAQLTRLTLPYGDPGAGLSKLRSEDVPSLRIYAPAPEVARELNNAFLAGVEYALLRLVSQHQDQCACEPCMQARALMHTILHEQRSSMPRDRLDVISLQKVGP